MWKVSEWEDRDAKTLCNGKLEFYVFFESITWARMIKLTECDNLGHLGESIKTNNASNILPKVSKET